MPFRNRTHSDDYPVSGLQSLTFGRHFKILLGSNLSININFCSKKEARIRVYGFTQVHSSARSRVKFKQWIIFDIGEN